MSIERANEVLLKCTYLRFANRERHSINVRQLSQNAMVTLFQMLGILESKEGSLINLGLKFTKRGECRVRIGNNIIISIPDAGTRKEFQTKLLRRWTNHDRYIWYSVEDKLDVLSGMEFDGELKDKNPRYDVIHTDICVDESVYPPFPDLSDASLDEDTEPTRLGTIGTNVLGRGSNKAMLAATIAMAANRMMNTTMPTAAAVSKTGRDATETAIANYDAFSEESDNKPQVVVVGSSDKVWAPNDSTGLVACIKQRLQDEDNKLVISHDMCQSLAGLGESVNEDTAVNVSDDNLPR